MALSVIEKPVNQQLSVFYADIILYYINYLIDEMMREYK